MTVKVADMTVDELRGVVRQTVEDTLIEMIGNPDQGLELRDTIRQRLQRSIAARKAGAPLIPAEKVAEELGLRWK